MTRCCGIDLHANNSVLVIIDEQDKVVFEKRLANGLADIKACGPQDHESIPLLRMAKG